MPSELSRPKAAAFFAFGAFVVFATLMFFKQPPAPPNLPPLFALASLLGWLIAAAIVALVPGVSFFFVCGKRYRKASRTIVLFLGFGSALLTCIVVLALQPLHIHIPSIFLEIVLAGLLFSIPAVVVPMAALAFLRTSR